MTDKPEPQFYVKDNGLEVFSRPPSPTLLGFRVCTAEEDVDGAAEEIATALNRLPEAEAKLLEIVAAIRQIGDTLTGPAADLLTKAQAIEDWMVNG